MSLEIEASYQVDEKKMPLLDRYPYENLDQYYLSPKHSPYLDVVGGEWRVRKITKPTGDSSWTATVKLGDKEDGVRQEVEIGIKAGDFGTNEADINSYAYGRLSKRRFYLEDGITLDRFGTNAGNALQAEKEFSSLDEMRSWEPPEWLSLNLNLQSSRQRAIETTPKTAFTDPAQQSSEEVIAKLKYSPQSIISVSGMSGSGKSTLARKIVHQTNAAYLEADHFHIGITKLMAEFGIINHDLLEAYDYQKVRSMALGLSSGLEQSIPIYDFYSGEPAGEKVIYPSNSGKVVVDGLYAALAFNQDKSKHISLLMNTPVYVSVIRRILRDSSIKQESERNVSYTPEETVAYLHHFAIPSYLSVTAGQRYDYIVK
jgi:uridine kinase